MTEAQTEDSDFSVELLQAVGIMESALDILDSIPDADLAAIDLQSAIDKVKELASAN